MTSMTMSVEPTLGIKFFDPLVIVLFLPVFVITLVLINEVFVVSKNETTELMKNKRQRERNTNDLSLKEKIYIYS